MTRTASFFCPSSWRSGQRCAPCHSHAGRGERRRVRQAGGGGEGLFRARLKLLTEHPARLVAIGGLSGSGKTTIAEALAAHVGAPPGARIVESDRIRKALHGVPAETRLQDRAYRPEVSERVHREMARRAGLILSDGLDRRRRRLRSAGGSRAHRTGGTGQVSTLPGHLAGRRARRALAAGRAPEGRPFGRDRRYPVAATQTGGGRDRLAADRRRPQSSRNRRRDSCLAVRMTRRRRPGRAPHDLPFAPLPRPRSSPTSIRRRSGRYSKCDCQRNVTANAT